MINVNLTKRQQEEVSKALKTAIRQSHIGLEPMLNPTILTRVYKKITDKSLDEKEY
jgi:hypothetical protein